MGNGSVIGPAEAMVRLGYEYLIGSVIRAFAHCLCASDLVSWSVARHGTPQRLLNGVLLDSHPGAPDYEDQVFPPRWASGQSGQCRLSEPPQRPPDPPSSPFTPTVFQAESPPS